MSARVSKLERAEAVARLGNLLAEVPVLCERRNIYVTTVRASGVTHDYRVAIIVDNDLVSLTHTVGLACGYRLVSGYEHDSVRVRGGGMDMRFELVDTIMRTAEWGPDWQKHWTVRS
jgi:hypothetical protein